MIFYFSATGNCKYAAQRIAASTEEAIHSITECVKQQQYHFSSDNGTVGIITPTYAWGLPSIVRDFLHALVLDEPPILPVVSQHIRNDDGTDRTLRQRDHVEKRTFFRSIFQRENAGHTDADL